LKGINKLIHRHTIFNFIDLCGQLRFQYRWAQLPRVPKTSVLGHSMTVACISYFFARENNSCSKRIYNDFFGGLYHDLPEAVTRDIISPLKEASQEFEKLLKKIERELAEKEIFPLIEPEWIDELKYFSQNEFSNKIKIKGKIAKNEPSVEDINEKYNSNEFEPYDGKFIRAADHLASFLEVWDSVSNGIKPQELYPAAKKIRVNYKNKKFGKIEMNLIYNEFSEF
jgi:putative hydrolases of HD superfamily